MLNTGLSHGFVIFTTMLAKRVLLPALLSGGLCFLAWPPMPLTPLLFVAFVPLLYITHKVPQRFYFLIGLFAGLFFWNLSTTWWIWNSTLIGGWLAIIANSLLMCIPWLGYRWVRSTTNRSFGYLALVVFWMSFEYLHLQDWGLSWPWLTLGNAFAARTEWVQWYAITGSSGGTLWVLLVNVLLFELWQRSTGPQLRLRQQLPLLLTLALVLTIPLLVSRLLVPAVQQTNTENVVVVQPNIDPYEKVSGSSFEQQLQQLLQLSAAAVDSNTTLLVWPETALYAPGGFNETELPENTLLRPLFAFLQQYPQLHLFTGIESYRIFNSKNSIYTRPIEGSNLYYEVYNGSVLLSANRPIQFYHKSMLVPGVETLPRFLLFLGPVFEKFGGTTGGYARQEERTPVPLSNHYRLAPAICYESIYSEYMSRYRKAGANLVAIITNDGWWGNTPGHKQHLQYARLRAIENRCWVARSANTGISAFIDPAGNIVEQLPWWTVGTLKYNVPAYNHPSFYARNGDWLSKLALVLSILSLGWMLYQQRIARRKHL